MKQTLLKKLREALVAVLPITLVIAILNFAVKPMPVYNFAAFVLGAVALIIGMVFYSLGADIAVSPIGEHIAMGVAKRKHGYVAVIVSFLIGLIVTIAEPDLGVLAGQTPGIDKYVLIISVAVGVGLFVALSIFRICFNIDFSKLIIIIYAVLFGVVIFAGERFIPLAFDSGGVATGPITVPLIMAFGIGVGTVLGNKESEEKSFGLIGICAVGPILAVLILGFFYKTDGAFSAVSLDEMNSVGGLLRSFGVYFAKYLGEVGISLLPIVAFFLIMQFAVLKLPNKRILRILIGVAYTYIGLVFFLAGVNFGFMPAGGFIGESIAGINAYLLIPLAAVIGAFIVLAEPSVQVLKKQVFDITSGTVKTGSLMIALAVSVAAAMALSMVRIITRISFLYIIIPGYLIALILSFFVPRIFTAIAFDSGGVASGPMTATFVLPFAIGASVCLGGNPMTDAFGTVATITMMPVITVQLIGLSYSFHTLKLRRKSYKEVQELIGREGEIIDFEEEANIPTAETVKKPRKRRVSKVIAAFSKE